MHLKTFQREDLARAALHDGLILGLDTGLGKTICAYAWPLLKVGVLKGAGDQPVHPICPAEPVLIIASGDLHAQIMDEGHKHFGVTPTILDSQERFLKLSTLDAATGRRVLAPGYYLTTYTQLSRNGVTPFPELNIADPIAMLKLLNLSERDLEEFYAGRRERYEKHYTRLMSGPNESLADLSDHWFTLRKHANRYFQMELDESFNILKDFAPQAVPSRELSVRDLTCNQRRGVAGRLVAIAHITTSVNIGESRYQSRTNRPIKCVYSPSLADLCANTFAVVVADEGVKLKGEDTLVGKGVRQMAPKFRLVLTATPIKNRLPDVFRLAHWATGSHRTAHPRFPFGDDDAGTFADEFLVTERNLSAEERSETSRRYVKKTPQVCNIHRLWKLFAPIILRRRKTDCGEDLVSMTRQVVRVPMGKAQAAVYKFHLQAEYLDCNGKPALGAKLQALRIAAANPTSALLKRPETDGLSQGTPRSSLSFIPKLASGLSLVHQILERQEQVIVFSAFHDSLDALSDRLREAGVKHVLLDGRTSPSRRGSAAALFKQGLDSGVPVMLAGVECMSEGHSFHLCNNVVLLAYSWAFDKFVQAINRIWRLNSVKPVNVYPVIADGSIDRKLESNIQEKGDAADLVLDGRLIGEDPCEVNLAELLQIAAKDFAEMKDNGTIDERDLEKEWPALCAQLALAMRGWGAPSNILPLPVAAPSPAPAPTPPPIAPVGPAAPSAVAAVAKANAPDPLVEEEYVHFGPIEPVEPAPAPPTPVPACRAEASERRPAPTQPKRKPAKPALQWFDDLPLWRAA